MDEKIFNYLAIKITQEEYDRSSSQDIKFHIINAQPPPFSSSFHFLLSPNKNITGIVSNTINNQSEEEQPESFLC